MSPKFIIKRPNKTQFDSECVIKANHLRPKIDEITDNLNPLTSLPSLKKLSTFKSVMDFTERLRSFHTKSTMNYRKKFGIDINNYTIRNVIDPFNEKKLKKILLVQVQQYYP